jgi:hypothetical protein
VQTFLTIVSSVILIFAACTVVLNWACVIASYHFRRQGIKRHVSTVPLLAQLLVVVAAIISSRVTPALIPGWLFGLVAFTDVALLQILYHPVFLLRRKLRART